ncbi:hypothetical protein ACIRPH_09270 [Nocardiopsis sp. NPDC101807]|uniref:hypothetical protein n=1 Tax=Nocardiopsis sp. NPDC101807 TaxID=3364339 RepID=UPI00380EA5AF
MSRPREFGPVQLARWLGLDHDQLRRALHRGLVPPPDIDDRKWSEALAKTLPERTEAVLADLAASPTPENSPAPEPTPLPKKKTPGRRGSYGSLQLARLMGLKEWQVKRAAQRGLIPPPDIDGRRWSQHVAETLPEHAADVAREIGDHPGLGSQKAADRVAARTGLTVTRDDVAELAARGTLPPVGDYMGSALYSLRDLDALTEEHLAPVIEQRRAWIEASLTGKEAADLLGWSVGRFEVTAERHGLLPGRLDRYPRADVERLDATRAPG